MEHSMFENIKKLFKKDEVVDRLVEKLSEEIESKEMSNSDIQAFLIASSSAQWHVPSFETSVVEGYAGNPIVYRCVNLRGDSMGSLKWLVTNKKGIEIPNHPLQKLIDRPNTQQSQTEFFSNLSSYRDLGGDGYIVANMVGGKPQEITLARPDDVSITPGANGVPATYSVSAGGSLTTYEVDQVTGRSDVLQWKAFNPTSDLYGMTVLAPAGKPVDVFNESQEHVKKTLQNGAALAGVLSTEQTLDTVQFERLAEALNSKYAGGANAGKMMITEGGMKYTPTASTLKDLMLVDMQTEQSRYISQAFGVPDQMIGIPGSNTFANFSEARIYYIENTVMPMADSLQEKLNDWLVPMYGDNIILKYDIKSIVGLEERRSQIYARLQSVTFMTMNEKRVQAGLQPKDGGDDLPAMNKPEETDAPETDDTPTTDQPVTQE